jgi:hypothetical protein
MYSAAREAGDNQLLTLSGHDGGMVVNYTVIALGAGAFVGMLMLRRWLWLIAAPPAIAIAVYAILNTIKHGH